MAEAVGRECFALDLSAWTVALLFVLTRQRIFAGAKKWIGGTGWPSDLPRRHQLMVISGEASIAVSSPREAGNVYDHRLVPRCANAGPMNLAGGDGVRLGELGASAPSDVRVRPERRGSVGRRHGGLQSPWSGRQGAGSP